MPTLEEIFGTAEQAAPASLADIFGTPETNPNRMPLRDFGTTAGGVELMQAGAVPAAAFELPAEPSTGLGRAWDAAKLVFGRGTQDLVSGLAGLAGKAYEYTPFAFAERMGTRARYGAQADTGSTTGAALEDLGQRGMAAAEEARIGHMAQYGADPLSIATAAASFFPDEIVAKAAPAVGAAAALGTALPRVLRATRAADAVDTAGDVARAVDVATPPAPALAVTDLEPVGPAAREALRAPESMAPPTVRTELPRMSDIRPGDLVDTVGQGRRFHGSKSPLDPVFGDWHYSSANYYGPGFYTTDSAKVGLGYTKRRGALFEVEHKGGLKILDMEKPVPDWMSRQVDLMGIGYDKSRAGNVRELYDELRESSVEEGLSMDDMQEVFESLSLQAQEHGYQGMRHRGGLLTGGEPHDVVIHFNPAETVGNVTRVNPVSLRRAPDLSPPGVVTDLELIEAADPVRAAAISEELVQPAAKAAGVPTPSVGAFGRARKFWDRWMTSTRGLSDETFRAIESRESMISAAKIAAKDDASKLNTLMDDYVTANPGVDAAAFKDQVRAHLIGEADGSGLPENIRKATARMRNEVDSMTTAMIDEGMVGEGLADVFRQNLGSYMTRSYRAFDDPKWIEKLRESGEWADLKAEMRTLEKYADLPEAELEGVMEALAKNDQAYLQSQGGLGTIGTGIYQHRANVPEPVRKLLGEYTDPAAMHYRTVERMARNIESHRMYTALADIGRREGWISDVPLPGVAARVQGGAPRNPLGEVFMPEEMRQLIEGTGEKASSKWAIRVAMKAAGLAKEAKTVQSVQAQFRNFESNQLLLLGGGNLGGPLASLAPWRRGQSGLGQAAAAREFGRRGGRRVARAADEMDLADINTLKAGHIKTLYDEAAEHGLVGQQIDLADMKHFLAESDARFLEPEVKGLRKAGRVTRQSLRTSYEAGDVIPKLAAWKSEQAKYRWAHPDWTEAQVKAHAAEHVKDIMPTYSRVPRSIEAIRQQPFLADFISFASEIPRNVKNNLKIGLSDIREGKRTGNKRLMYVGAHRLASQGAALGGTQIAKTAIRAMSPEAPSESVSEAVAPLLPPWLENGQYFVSKIDGDNMVVWDLSFMDPYAQIKDTFIAGVRGGEVDPAAWDRASAAARSFAEVYLAEGVLVGSAIDAYRGRTSRGKEVWREQDPTWAKFVQGGIHLGKAVAPGTLTSLGRIAKGSEGSRDIRGRTYELGSEVAALFGPRPYTVNIPGSLEYAAGRFTATKSEAAWREGLTDDKSLTAQERIDPDRLLSPSLANDYRRSSTDALVRTLVGAEAAGFSRGRIVRILDAGGMSEADAHRVISGIDAAKSGGETWDAWLDQFTLISVREAAERRRKRELRR